MLFGQIYIIIIIIKIPQYIRKYFTNIQFATRVCLQQCMASFSSHIARKSWQTARVFLRQWNVQSVFFVLFFPIANTVIVMQYYVTRVVSLMLKPLIKFQLQTHRTIRLSTVIRLCRLGFHIRHGSCILRIFLVFVPINFVILCRFHDRIRACCIYKTELLANNAINNSAYT